MAKVCPHCGASLPEEAAFCPNCAGSLNQRAAKNPPRLPAFRLFHAAGLLALAVILAACVFFYTQPKTYEGTGEVSYTGKNGSYQLLLNYMPERYTPLPKLETVAGNEDSYRFPCYLYVNQMDTGADAGSAFLADTASVQVHIEQDADISSPIQCSDPEPMDFNPDAALISLIDFTRESAGQSRIVWTISMKNGDTIRLGMDLSITTSAIYEYDSQDADLSTAQGLQALIDRAAAETKDIDSVTITLPPVTYTEPVVLHTRSFSLTGTEENGKRTTFAAGIQMRDECYWISYLTGIDFAGDGSGVGISAAGRLWTRDCRFTNWKTALLSFGNTWINTTDCVFADNEIGLHYNSQDVSASDSHFTGNTFTGCGTAVLLENVPTDVEMDFGQCVFEGNGTDIDNLCGQPVDVSQAEFRE